MSQTDNRPAAPGGGSMRAAKTQRRPIIQIMFASAIILSVSFGVRTVFGGFNVPIADELFGGATAVFALSFAIQNLLWGVTQPLFGAIADKYGDRPAMWLGLACYAVGLLWMAFAHTALELHLAAGVLVGAGIAGTAFGLVLSVVGRASTDATRSQNLGIATALGSIGQVLIPLIGGELIKHFDWRENTLILLVLLIPLALCIPLMRAPEPTKTSNTALKRWALDEMSAGAAVRAAFSSTSYVLLVLGFFVCGFHLAFIGMHFPTFVENFCTGTDMSAEELRAFGVQALGLVGLANIIGTYAAGQLGARYRKPYLLSAIYAARALLIVWFIMNPVTQTSILIFTFTMGLLWLSTVPLTSGLVFAMFGPRYAGTLYGVVFLSHQVGSFVGVNLGSYAFDNFGNYDLVWYAGIGLGIFSALVHLPVREIEFQRVPT